MALSREVKIIRTSYIGIIANALLVVMKITVGIFAKSIAIITDGINNLTDALSSLITIIGTKLSLKKADKKHPFGHGRIEYITSFIIAVLVILAGGTAIKEAISGLINNDTLSEYSNLTLILISVGILIKIALGIYYRIEGKKLNSAALLGSGADAISDSILSLSTLVVAIICIFVPEANKYHIDNYLSIIIGLFIIKTGIDFLREASSSIIGKRSEQSTINQLKQMVNSFPEVQGAYDLILHNYGPNYQIGSVHVQIDDHYTAKEIHNLSKKIQEKAYRDFGIVLTVGIYASNDSDPKNKEIKQNLLLEVRKHQEIVQMHGFYVDNDTNVVTYDLMFDYKIEDSVKQEIISDIASNLSKLYPEYKFYVIEDMDITD